MAEISLQQIQNKLEEEFDTYNRKIIFWYDDNAEFLEDVQNLTLKNAKIFMLEKDNLFYAKYLLEFYDKETNYLVYAPFERPQPIDNPIEDIVLYSTLFYADKPYLLCNELGINIKYKNVVKKYSKFFASKERIQKLLQLDSDLTSEYDITLAIMSVLCKNKIVSFNEVLKTLIIEGFLENNIFEEFKKYSLLDAFWEFCEKEFDYKDNEPSLLKLTYTLFVNTMSSQVTFELPKSLTTFKTETKINNSINFINSMMNNVLYSDSFNVVSKDIYNKLNLNTIFKKVSVDDFYKCEIFEEIDNFIIDWILDKLLNNNIQEKLNDVYITDICTYRKKLHFGDFYNLQYNILENTYYIINSIDFKPEKTQEHIIKNYIQQDYIIDKKYRYFYYNYDKLEENIAFESLKELVENIYTNKFLNPLNIAFNEAYESKPLNINLQTKFFDTFVAPLKERVVVIISDALRYEVGKTLFDKIENDEKLNGNINYCKSFIPSITKFGMSALLPHKTLEINENFKMLIDDKICEDLKSREAMLKKYVPNSKALNFDDIKNMKINELRDICSGQQVIYIYHNQIDARGDKLNTENEVFNACEEAIEEIFMMIKRLGSANNTRVIVTSDHGFIYKRNKILEQDKISDLNEYKSSINRRFILHKFKINKPGVFNIPLKDMLKNLDERYICLPKGTDIFKVVGGGQNFVHGGSSVQENIIPIIDVKISRGVVDVKNAKIELVSLLNKITNLNINLEFIQKEPISDVVKETTYKVYFVDDNGNKISNECNYIADKRDSEAIKRIFKLKFNFKNMKYDNRKKYYLVVYDTSLESEISRQDVKMDLLFVDDFGFDN
nr:BREX-1 system phosphatase PglZ type A [uncultured Tyzzerella sp.]